MRRDYELWAERLFARWSDAVLTDDEAARCWDCLCADVDAALASRALVEAEASLLALLMLATARAEGYLAEVRTLDQYTDAQLAADADLVGIAFRRGLHLFAIAGRAAFWQPKAPSPVLRAADTRVQLLLPATPVTFGAPARMPRDARRWRLRLARYRPLRLQDTEHRKALCIPAARVRG